MIAAIAGATGLVGKVLLEMLLDSDRYHKVIVIGRSQPQLAAHHYGEEKLHFIQCQLDEIHEITLTDTIDHGFCCLGTTIQKAGSQQAFIDVDKVAVIAFAQLLKNQRHSKLVFQMISASNANAESSLFYSRVKGETEQALQQLALPHLQIFQPSLLLGHRDEHRPLEDIAQWLFGITAATFIGPLKKYQPIKATAVAQVMFDSASSATAAVSIFDNAQIHLLTQEVS